MGKPQDPGGTLKLVTHKDNRLIPLMDKILDTQLTLNGHVVSHQTAPRVSVPALHLVRGNSAAGPSGESSAHRTQVRSKEHTNRVDGFTTY